MTDQGQPHPALVFLNRGEQLNRLLQVVILDLQSKLLGEGKPLGDLSEILERSNQGTLDADLRSYLAKSRERVSDAQLVLQLFFSRAVDAFRIFLEDIVRSILLAKASLLKGADIEDVMEELGSKRFLEFLKTVSKNYGFVFFPEGRDLTAVTLVFTLRNLITHQYGIVTNRFLSRYPDPALSVGQPYPFTSTLYEAKSKVLIELSTSIAKQAAEQFGLRWSGSGVLRGQS